MSPLPTSIRRLAALLALAGLGLALAVHAAAARAASTPPLAVDAGHGQRLVVERSPFRLVLVDRARRTVVATVPGREGPPLRPPGLDGPQPLEPLGPLGGFPALGFVVGAQAGVTFPASFFTGNRLFGAEAGGLVSVVGVREARPIPAGGLHLTLATDDPAAAAATLDVRRLPAGGVQLDLRPPDGLAAIATVFTLASPPGEGLYGLGGRRDAFDQRGLLRNAWVEEQNSGDQRTEPVAGADPTGATGPAYQFPNGSQAAYYPQPLLLGSRGWAAWVGQTELSRVDLAHSRADAVRWGVAAPHLTLSLAGGGLEPASRAYTGAVGRAPAAPRWALEPWLDVINQGEGDAAPNGAGFSGGARVRRTLEEIVRQVHRLRLPVRTLGAEGWQAVPGRETFFPSLRALGFHLSAYWNPFTAPGTPAYAEARARGLLVSDPTGRPYPLVTNRGNQSNVVDFTHPDARRFWTEQIARSARLGFEGFMEDFGEYVVDGMRFHDGTPPAVEHNAYPVQYHRAGRAAVDAYARAHPGFRPFFYVRAGFHGTSASTPGVFPGDETTDWSRGSGLPSVVPAMLNLALGGEPAFSTDVGGYLDLYTPPTTPELFTRWTQLAAFTPILRVHDDTQHGSRYPWDFDRATLDAYRRYARAKVRLVGLVEAWSKRAARDGTVGPVRPLVLDDPSRAARSVGDEWLLGRDLLVAPVLTQGARQRRVYLPANGSWQRVVVDARGALVPVGAPLRGGRSVSAPAPLADIPLFRRVRDRDAEGARRRGPARAPRFTG